MAYYNYKCEDFLDDASFQSYMRKDKEGDIIFWEHWIKQNPANLTEFKKACAIFREIQETYSQTPAISKKEELDRLLANIEKLTQPDIFIQYRKEVWIRYAAIFILLIGIGFVFTLLYKKNSPPQNTNIVYKEIKTPKGKRFHLRLSDGTNIWVNSESTFKYPEVFNGVDRKVYLQGEAYFDVTEDKTKPFYVYAGDLRVKVLGTSFNVRSYPEDGFIETTLEKGKVNIERLGPGGSQSEVISLIPNQKVTLYMAGHLPEFKNSENTANDKLEKIASKNAIISKNIETYLYTSWKDEKLTFRGEQLDKLKLRLERWYNIPIVVKDPELLNKKLTGTFVNEPIKDALRALSVASEFEFEIKNDTVYLMKDN